jgi:glycosidase
MRKPCRRPPPEAWFSSLALFVISSLAAAQSTPERRDWRDGATCYEVFVRSFRDSDGDGIGDLKGLTASLDYINDGNPQSTRSLGARCLWLMPIMESPSYHGYDVSDYYRVARAYGTNEDFKRLVAESHRRGIKVLVDMVINHASSEWPPFQQALRDPASATRDWFRFSPTRGPNNRWGNNNWHQSPVREEFYYGFFWRGMPDLNYEQPGALGEMKRVASFWLNEMGADGFRLDAVKYLVEDGAVVEDTPRTHAVLREYAAHVRSAKAGAFTIGEVFDSTGALLHYYPDQLDAYFAFEIADSLVAGVQRGDASGVLAPVLRLQQALPANRWAPFLRNHDQPRTRTEFNGDWGKSRVASFLLLTLPGLPFVYYGEELGMTGGKPDERIRTPMAWSPTLPHAGFTTGSPWQRLADDSLEANVATQDHAGSLLAQYRTLIHLRDAVPALAVGTLAPATSSHPQVLAFTRRAGDAVALVVANLGERSTGEVTLTVDLPPGRLQPPRTLFGETRAWQMRRAAAPSALTAPLRVRIPRLPPYAGAIVAFTTAPR